MLRHSDWLALLRFADELGEVAPESLDDVLAAIAAALRRLVACDAAGYGTIDRATGRATLRQFPAELAFDDDELAFLVRHIDELPFIDLPRVASCAPPAVTAQPIRALRSSDFYSQRELRSLGTYREVFARRGFEHTMVLPTFDLDGAWVGGFGMHRSGSPFRDREAALFELARPHIVSAIRRALRHRPAPVLALAYGSLTARELEVLRWIAAGKTNREIATLLAVSVNTVRNHVAQVLAKLGVENRTGAAMAVAGHASATPAWSTRTMAARRSIR
jgi:DNA-binding CsgD family transcriptional regulator